MSVARPRPDPDVKLWKVNVIIIAGGGVYAHFDRTARFLPRYAKRGIGRRRVPVCVWVCVCLSLQY